MFWKIGKQEKKEKKQRIWKWYDSLMVWVLTIILIANAVMIIIMSGLLINLTDKCDYLDYAVLPKDLIVDNNITTNITLCDNFTLTDTAECLSGAFNSIFNYNVTTDYDYANFTEVDSYIRTYGGDCHEAAVWFQKSAEELGYYAEYVSLITSVNETEDTIYRELHAFTILSDDTGYCILDQGSIVRCFKFLTNSTAVDSGSPLTFIITSEVDNATR